MKKPKLALIPAAQGSKFYSVLPSSGVGDFDFSRSGSATRINSQGLIEEVGNGVSRLNYPIKDGEVAGCPHHILEPQRTNYISYSEDFSQWTATGTISVTDNQIISPDGTQNASILDFTSANSSDVIYIFTGDRTGSLSRSIYLKGEVGGETLDLSDPHIGGGSNITLTTEWQRFEYKSTIESSNSGILLKNSAGNVIHAWGGQLEEGYYSTSYIPTNGSSVTRSAETATGSGNTSTFNDSEGVLYVEISGLISGEADRSIVLSDGTTSNYLRITLHADSNRIDFYSEKGVNYSNYDFSQIDDLKIAFQYKENDWKIYINGSLKGTDTSALTFSPNTLSDLSFSLVNNNPFYGRIKSIAVFKEALSDEELATLTKDGFNPIPIPVFEMLAENGDFLQTEQNEYILIE